MFYVIWKRTEKQRNQKEFRIEQGDKRKSDKLYIKWKGYDNLFNSWIDKEDFVK